MRRGHPHDPTPIRRRRRAAAIQSIAKPPSIAGASLESSDRREDIEHPKMPWPCAKAVLFALPPAPVADVPFEPPAPEPVEPFMVPVPVLPVPVPVPLVAVLPVPVVPVLVVPVAEVDVFWMHCPIDVSIEVHILPIGQPFPPLPRQPMMQVFAASSQTMPEVRPPQSASFRHMTHVLVVGSHCWFIMQSEDIVQPSHLPALGPMVAQSVERQTVMPFAAVHGPSPLA